MNINSKYLEHIAQVDLSSGYCYKILLMLLVKEYTQSQISELLQMQKQNVSKYFKELEQNNLIFLSRAEGKNKFFKAATDIKTLQLLTPGQIRI
jgi:DNA-binding transcriptional regulator GbsR (MarR family)